MQSPAPGPLGCTRAPSSVFRPSAQSPWIGRGKERFRFGLAGRKVNIKVRAGMPGPCSLWGLHLSLVNHPEKFDSQSSRSFPFPSQPLSVLSGPLLTRLLFPYVSRHPLLSLPWREQWELGTAGGGEVGWENESHCCGYLSFWSLFSLKGD